MLEQMSRHIRKWNVLLALLIAALVVVIGLLVSASLATGVSGSPSGHVSQVDTAPLTGQGGDATGGSGVGAPQPAPTVVCPWAHHYLVSEAGGPPNGGTVRVGDRFVLDLMVHTGATASDAQQAYLTYTYPLLQNVQVTSSVCVLVSTVRGDLSTFDTVLQNEICNGPSPCIFRGIGTDPGSFAYASGALFNPPAGGDFRTAQAAFCAIAPGQAVLRWQFQPAKRHTEVAPEDIQLHAASCYEDYIINIIPATKSP